MERQLHIEALAHGGDGLARDGGEVIFVPDTAPGDRVRVVLAEKRSGARRARLLEVLEPGPDRVPVPCPAVGTCGGCQLQHLSTEAQREARTRAVREALQRIGGFRDPPVAAAVGSPRPSRYRRRLRVHPVGGSWGFARRGSPRAVATGACLLAEPEVEALVEAISRSLAAGEGPGSVRTFTVDVSDEGRGAVHFGLAKAPSAVHRTRTERLVAKIPGLRGAVLTGDGTPAVLLGQPVRIERGHRGLRVRPDLFAQANRLGARLLAEAVAATVEPGSSVLEVFAGSGTLTLYLADRASRVVATEGAGPALELCRAALAENGWQARLLTGPAARVVRGLATEGDRFDHVVMDPPRAGAREMLEDLVRLAPRRITYVSCDPATFARDAAVLASGGFVLERVVPFDLFPHTGHVELVAELTRADPDRSR